MDVLQYIIDRHSELKSGMTSFLQDAGQNVDSWLALQGKLSSKIRTDRDFLLPEVADLSSSAEKVVAKAEIMLDQLEELMKRAEAALKAADQFLS